MPINLSTLTNQTNSLQLCKAWVNFNGTTATPSTIRSSYNVSSITKNGTGDYTVNFATAMADANYSVSGIIGNTPSGAVAIQTNETSVTRTTSSFGVTCYNASWTAVDSANVQVSVFGN